MSPSGSEFGEPVLLGTGVNGEGDEYYPSVDRRGTIYFTSKRKTGTGGEDIYFSTFERGRYQPAKLVVGAVNSERPEFNAMIAAEGDYLIFSSWGRADGAGGGDLYISYRGDDGVFEKAINMPINSPSLDYSPALSPDGAYLFFSSKRSSIKFRGRSEWRLDSLHAALRRPFNGAGDIFWVKMRDWQPK